MSTRCNIGYRDKNGDYIFVYNHYDGYPSHMFDILKKKYNSFEKAKELVDGGDMAYVEEDEVGYYSDVEDWERIKPRKALSIHEIRLLDRSTEYIYVFQDGKWVYYKRR